MRCAVDATMRRESSSSLGHVVAPRTHTHATRDTLGDVQPQQRSISARHIDIDMCGSAGRVQDVHAECRWQ